MNNVSSTHKRRATGQPAAANGRARDGGENFLAVADDILAGVLRPGRGPTKRGVERFLEDGSLERVLALYARAMNDDADDPSVPWNLGSALDRLGQHEMAFAYLARAIKTAERVGDEELAGAHAHLALADTALKARQGDLATAVITRARKLDPNVRAERYLRAARRLRLDKPASAQTSNADSSRKGTAVEHLVAAHCMLASDFELNVSTSLVDDEGVDLVFHRRDATATMGVQVKSRSWESAAMQRNETFIAQVRSQTFRPRNDLFLLFVAFEPTHGDYGPVWLVPSQDFAKLPVNSRNRRRFVASANIASRDQWSDVRLERSELPGRILEVLLDLER